MKPDTMQRYTLNRTGETPATLTGVHLGTVSSSNASTPSKETTAKQWFIIDLYRTAAGTTVAHMQYRAGSKLGREVPVDRVLSSPEADKLITALYGLAITEFITGWPGMGSADANRGRDYTSNYNSIREHGHLQLTEAIVAAATILCGAPPSEEIV